MGLTATLGDIQVYNMLKKPSRSQVTDDQRAFARQSDIGPWDVASFCKGTRAFKLVLIMRCPKQGSVGFQGIFTPKRMEHAYQQGSSEPVKTGLHGLRAHPDTGEIFVSDYDLMSVWEVGGEGYRKINTGMAPKGQNEIVDLLNAIFFDSRRELRAPFQHGGQDDFVPSPGHPHPNLKPSERCAAFREGEMTYLPDIVVTRAYYARHGLRPFPYDQNGKFTG